MAFDRHTQHGTDHIVILDGTLSSLMPGEETNAGLAYKLIRARRGRTTTIFYEPGIQWPSWAKTVEVMAGIGINRQIRRAYQFLCHRWRPGDRIFLLGYSRGAYAVRSLAGVIDRYGLLRPDIASDRFISYVYSYYQAHRSSRYGDRFAAKYCQRDVDIQMVGVWDTVKALGLRAPGLWRIAPMATEFHSDQLGHAVRHGFHALALHETRRAFEPVLWRCPPGWEGHAEQVWFRGSHGDIGGQLTGCHAARPLSNIPFVWMMERAEACGLDLPRGWRADYPRDVTAPSVGVNRGWGKLFLNRSRRVVCSDRSEHIHPSVPDTDPARGPAREEGRRSVLTSVLRARGRVSQ
ncbi:DUF2235 domain-containing protein [Tropicimonas sp. S265A]|uniref:DUF2235 domain-containing protein n=1 Tax=Tropicimonas sp. S265A TaxID=3415134 RepID=UPI003C7EC337